MTNETSAKLFPWWPLRRQRNSGKDMSPFEDGSHCTEEDDDTVKFNNVTPKTRNTALPTDVLARDISFPHVSKRESQPLHSLEQSSTLTLQKPRKNYDQAGNHSNESIPGFLQKGWIKWQAFYVKYTIILLLIVYVCLARAYPKLGAVYLKPEITSSWMAVCFVFGKLSRSNSVPLSLHATRDSPHANTYLMRYLTYFSQCYQAWRWKHNHFIKRDSSSNSTLPYSRIRLWACPLLSSGLAQSWCRSGYFLRQWPRA
jgi:hypothetical protein